MIRVIRQTDATVHAAFSSDDDSIPDGVEGQGDRDSDGHLDFLDDDAVICRKDAHVYAIKMYACMRNMHMYNEQGRCCVLILGNALAAIHLHDV